MAGHQTLHHTRALLLPQVYCQYASHSTSGGGGDDDDDGGGDDDDDGDGDGGGGGGGGYDDDDEDGGGGDDDDDDDKSKFDDSDILRSFGQNSEIKLKKRAGQNTK